MARLLRAAIFMASFLYAGNAFAAGGACPSGADYLSASMDAMKLPLVTLASLGVTNCYYVSSAGSDSNSGMSESEPWAHLPGMGNCSSTCAAVTPTAGQGFIVRGGDTWTSGNFNIIWSWGGASTSPIYVGVDQTWYSGNSWTRPIWVCPNGCWSTSTNKSYDILDNIEMTGLVDVCSNCGVSGSESGNAPNYVNMYGTYQLVENLYIHGWSTTRTVSNSPSQAFRFVAGSNGIGDTMRYNVVDGSDSSKNMLFVTFQNTPIAYGNEINYVYTGLDGCGDDWHDNIVENSMVPGVVGGHQDGLYHVSQCYRPNSLIYNNIIRNTTSPRTAGSVKLWMNGNGGCPFSSCTSYAFNNVIYNVYPGNEIDFGGHNAVNYGTWYFFNNTIGCGTDSAQGMCGGAVGQGNTGGRMVENIMNNHWIMANAQPFCNGYVPGTQYVCNETGDLVQTFSTASSQGYTSRSLYAFQPTNANGSTITTAASATTAATRQSLCAAIGVVDATAGAACQSDTTYACMYDTTNHVMRCPTRTTVARAAEPNIGAYQFSSSQASSPNPPVDLTVTVQ
jgi:hypothetical protein